MKEAPWKEAIKEYFEEFLSFFFPCMAGQIDFEQGYEFLDKELEKIVKDAEVGRRLGDVLVKVFLKNGQEKWLLIHIEVQSYHEVEFAKRMFIYNYRIFDRYGIDVVSLAVLIDKDVRYKPNEYKRVFCEFELRFRFPVVKLIEYRGKEEELSKEKNPFGLFVLAYLREVEAGRDVRKKLFWKVTLVKMLYERGYSKEEVLRFYRFIDWMIELPEELTREFHEEIRKYEEVRGMEYITTAEKIGMEKGIQQGIQQGMIEEAREMVIEVLEEKFGVVPISVVEKVKSLNEREVLKNLHRVAIRVSNLEEFKEALKKIEE